MFTLTKEWLAENYGSSTPEQRSDTAAWLRKFGKNVPESDIEEWSRWKHLAEYQPNTPTIIPESMAAIGREFPSELSAHWFINRMRVPQSDWYLDALKIAKPHTILELGVGGDSAISTSLFLFWVNGEPDGHLDSVDRNPLGVTGVRYSKFGRWRFEQGDSVEFLNAHHGRRWDLIFIDTIHSYAHTHRELELAQEMSNFLLMDDCFFKGNAFDEQPGGVERAIRQFLGESPGWTYHPSIPPASNIMLLMKQ